MPSKKHQRLTRLHKSSLIDHATCRFIWNCVVSILYEAGTDKNMSYSILFHWQTFLDCRRGSCQDYFQSWQNIYYQRPLISLSLSDNDSARETTGDLHLNPSLRRVWQLLCMHSWHFMVASVLMDIGCNTGKNQKHSVYYKNRVSPFIFLVYYILSCKLPFYFQIFFDNSQNQALN